MSNQPVVLSKSVRSRIVEARTALLKLNSARRDLSLLGINTRLEAHSGQEDWLSLKVFVSVGIDDIDDEDGP